MNYYNDTSEFCCQWLQNLIDAGEIPPGRIDSRSITDVRPEDLDGYTQCHFFAGIGGWSLALRLAGAGDVAGIWTGSCPCQPFSSAGKQKAQADERHLWPAFFRLIRQCRPPVVIGEQVSSAIRHGWLDGVCTDLETAGYACGAAVLGAHSTGAPHIRQRLYWVANSNGSRPEGTGREGEQAEADRQRTRKICACGSGDVSGLGDCISERLEGRSRERSDDGKEQPSVERTGGAWDDFYLVHCRDNKTRRIGTGVQPLADGIPRDLGRRFPQLSRMVQSARANRVGRLRGYGNAIVPQVAAEFIKAFMDTTQR